MNSEQVLSDVIIEEASVVVQQVEMNTDPPKLKDHPYDKWVVLVNIWAADSTLEAEKRGNRVILRSLEGQDQDAAIEVGQTEITKNTGLATIIKKLDALYKVDDETKQYLLLEEFFNLKRSAEMTIADYTNRFDRLTNKLVAANVNLPEPALALTFLKNANVSEEKASLIRSTATAKTLAAFKLAMSKGCERPSQADLSSNVVQVKEESVLYNQHNARGGSRGRYNNYGSRGRSNNGRGRGGYSRGRGRGAYSGGNQKDTSYMNNILCHRCKKYGHYSSSCKTPWSEIEKDVYHADHGEDPGEYRPNQRRDGPEECQISFSALSDDL